MDVAARFGDNLRRHRKRADLSQEDTAVMASLHRTAVGMIERGLRLPRADTVVKLAAVLEIEPGELFEGIAWESESIRYGQFKPDPPDTL
ncbi:MAG TPA: helix-turn-helix transcriptional regulator [Solirubrobacterales bacterium]|nr:helix-turn-helix transcriptional regulator [Solirubrobacterales bacterium]